MSLTDAICVTCGTQYPTNGAQPASCPICEDDRQYVRPGGQEWSSLERMRGHYRHELDEIEPGLVGIRTKPGFAIGQRAQLISTPAGNLLWDCISYIDDETVAEVERRGGLAALAISHPHFHSSAIEWSYALGGIPVYIHADNAPWVMRPDPVIELWSGEQHSPLADLTLIRCGGHFPGSAVMHWPAGAEGRGALFTGDTIQVTADPRWVTFMYSYPNDIPLDPASVRRIAAAVEPFAFDRLYAAWPDKVVPTDAHAAVHRSADRYIAHLTGTAM